MDEMLIERNDVYYTKDTNQPYSGPVFALYPDDEFFLLEYEVTLKDGKLHGSYKTYFENGQIEREGIFKNGVQDGPFKIYNEYGQIEEKGTMKSDKIYGYHKIYYYEYNYDKPSEEITYENGIENGPYKRYHYNGQLEVEGTFNNGNQDGPWKFYYDNGQLEYEETYKDGIQDGLWKFYDENGQLEYEETYKYGDLIDSKEY
tara:strand:- start:2849 stop:3454 length:606 start_codon:yes stop_codon:yes gene_type:complete